MKLPKGIITKSITGGEGTLQTLLYELIDSKFSGYLRYTLETREGIADGNLVIDQGNVVIAYHKLGDDETYAETALKCIIKDSIDRSCEVNVHAAVDVEFLLDFYPLKAKLAITKPVEFMDTVKQFETEVLREFKMAKDKEKEEKRRTEFKRKLDKLRKEGYIVKRLEPLIDGDLNALAEAFDKFSADIKKLAKLKDTVMKFDKRKYSKYIESIQKKLKDPDEIPAIEKELEELEELVQTEERKRQSIRKRIEKWKSAGYNVSKLEKIIDVDIGKAWEETVNFMDNLQKLEALESEFKTIVAGNENLIERELKHELKAINEKLKDPYGILEIENAIIAFKKKVSDITSKYSQVQKIIESWKDKGYVITQLDAMIRTPTVPLADIKRAITKFESNIKLLDKLEDELHIVSKEFGDRFQEELGAIRSKLKEPEKVDEIRSEVSQLKTIGKRMKDELKNKLESWRTEGYDVSKLDDAFRKGVSLSELELVFHEFEDDISAFKELQERLGHKVVKAPAPPKPGVKVTEEIPEGPLFEASDPLPQYTFDTFVVGASNRFTHAASLAVAETPADAYNPLFIYSGPGLGKTHLLNAIGNYVKEQRPDSKVIYVTSEKFTNELIDAVRYDQLNMFRHKYRNADVLLIDDIQFLAGKESTQEEFFHTFNVLYNAHKQIVVTSDKPPKDIPTLEERLRSRFEGGLITDIQPPSLETKIIILRRKAKKENVSIPDEVIHLIASGVKSNIRELEGCLTKVVAYSKLTGQKIDLELTREVLKDTIRMPGVEPVAPTAPVQPPPPSPPPSIYPSQQYASTPQVPAPRPSSTPALDIIEKRLMSLKERLSPLFSEVEKRESGEPEKEPVPKPTIKAEVKPEMAPPPSQREEVKVEAPTAKCGNCGLLVSASDDTCPSCGIKFGGEGYECPNCGNMVTAEDTRCPTCGIDFETPEEEEVTVERKAEVKKPRRAPRRRESKPAKRESGKFRGEKPVPKGEKKKGKKLPITEV